MNSKTKEAIAIMTVLVMLSCTLMTALPSDAEADGQFTVEMRTGDIFSYTPRTNLSSTITATALDGMTFANGTMTASFDEVDISGALNTLITARWTSDGGDLTQTATQHITFRVHPHVTVDGVSSKEITRGVVGGAVAGTTIYHPDVSKATYGTVTEVSCSIMENDLIGWDEAKNIVYLKKDVPADVQYSEMTATITAVNKATDAGSTLMDESATVTLNIVIGSGLMIVSDDAIETRASETDATKNTYTVETNADMATGLTVTGYEFDTSGLPEGLVKSIDGAKIVFDPSVVEFPSGATGDDAVKEFTFTVTVKGQFNGKAVDDTKEVTLKVFADMVYTTVPSISDVTVMPDKSDYRKITLSAHVTDAEKIFVDWRDGTTSTSNVANSASDEYTAPHAYSKDGKYTIVLEAQNEAGSKCCYIRYDTSNGQFDVVEDEKPSEEHFDTYGWLFLLFAILALIFVLVYAMLYPAPIVLILACLFAVLSVVTYLY